MKTLSLCGGGIRGLIPAIWARDRGYHKDSFDLIAGTSTGAIIGAAIAKGMEPAEIVDLYLSRGREIFPGVIKRTFSRIGRTFTQGLSAPLYSNKALIRALKDEFGDTLMGELKCKFMAVTYDYTAAKPKIWKSWDSQDCYVPVWQVVAASCAAPVYFPSVEIGGHFYGDGGITGANNPSLVAIAEAAKMSKGGMADVECTCLGTGLDVRMYDGTDGYGPAQWATKIIGLMLDAPEQSVVHISRELLSDRFEYVNVPIDDDHAAMDDASEKNLAYLQALAATMS